MAKLFFIGATGHIGSAVLNAVHARFPDLEIVALVRDNAKANEVFACFENVKTIIGDFRDLAIIESESMASDIVLNTSPDLLAGSDDAIRAALSGLSSSPAKGFYVQTSGAFLIGEEIGGEGLPVRIWNDVTDIDALVGMPSTRYHQHTDQIVREFSSAVNVAIVSPTVVYGLSRSLGKKVPITVRDIVATVKQLSMGFTWGDGKNILGYIHVDDLAGIYVRLVADAIDKSAQREYQLWGPQAYYFATGEEMTFTTYMEALVDILRKNFILGSEVIRDFSVTGNTVEREMVDKIAAVHGCGMSVRCRSERAETLLLWKPQGPSLLETLPEIIEVLSLSVTP